MLRVNQIIIVNITNKKDICFRGNYDKRQRNRKTFGKKNKKIKLNHQASVYT